MENQDALETKDNSGELYLAFELSRKEWKLGFSDGKTAQIRRVSIEAGDLESAIEQLVGALSTHPNPTIVQSAIASARRRLERESGAGDRVAEMSLVNAVLGGLSTLREEAASDER